mmetsp:Transcript_68461/g.173139  ORF Transcript_68461/g.173139 Transcript_68461/m.173139 type:complete len:664 (+) Transcript_68461:1950-3941(+)
MKPEVPAKAVADMPVAEGTDGAGGGVDVEIENQLATPDDPLALASQPSPSPVHLRARNKVVKAKRTAKVETKGFAVDPPPLAEAASAAVASGDSSAEESLSPPPSAVAATTTAAPVAAVETPSTPGDDASLDSGSSTASTAAAVVPLDAELSDSLSDDLPKRKPPKRHRKKQRHHHKIDDEASANLVSDTAFDEQPVKPSAAVAAVATDAADKNGSGGGSASGDAALGEALVSGDSGASAGSPSTLKGGWQALLNDKKKNKKKKHVFKDQTSGIMDLVQTPSAYTAWQPPTQGDANYAASAKNDLLAAEKAFDVEDKDGASFLQLSSTSSAGAQRKTRAAASSHDPSPFLHVKALKLLAKSRQGSVLRTEEATALAVASILLEKYARALDSDALLRISQSHLTSDRLNDLWRKLRTAKVDGQMTAKEHQATKWCADFARESENIALQDSERRKRISASQGETMAQKRALLMEVSVRRRMIEVVERGEYILEQLNRTNGQEVVGVAAALQQLFMQARKISAEGGTEAEDETGQRIAAGELLGLAEGLSKAGAAELQDAVAGALARRRGSLRATREGLEKAEAKLQALEHKQGEQETPANAVDAGEGGAGGSSGSGSGAPVGMGSLRERYGQMCKWTLETIQARRHKQEGERDAVKATVAVLAAR